MALALIFLLLKELGGDGFKFLLFSKHGLRGPCSILVFTDEALYEVVCLAGTVLLGISALYSTDTVTGFLQNVVSFMKKDCFETNINI